MGAESGQAATTPGICMKHICPVHSLATPSASGIAPFQSIMEARVGGRAQLCFTRFPGTLSSLGGAHNRSNNPLHGHNAIGWEGPFPSASMCQKIGAVIPPVEVVENCHSALGGNGPRRSSLATPLVYSEETPMLFSDVYSQARLHRFAA